MFLFTAVVMLRERLPLWQGLSVAFALGGVLFLALTLAFLAVEGFAGRSAFGTAKGITHVLLILSGVVSALPLIWFANGARLIPLFMVGFLQYLTPTLHLLLTISTSMKRRFSAPARRA